MKSDFETPPRYSVSDYQKWEGDWELIDGYPYAMSSPKMKHQLIALNFGADFREAIKKSGCKKCRVVMDVDWILTNETVVRPDVVIVCGDITDDFLRYPPTLIVEIFSESTRLKDRNVKFNIYESAGVQFYLLADPTKEVIEVFELVNNRFISKKDNFCFQLDKDCSIEINTSSVFI